MNREVMCSANNVSRGKYLGRGREGETDFWEDNRFADEYCKNLKIIKLKTE